MLEGGVELTLSIGKRQPRRQRRAAAALRAAEQQSSALLCFDVGSFSTLMSPAETHALSRQCAEAYGYNRKLAKPFAIAFAGLCTAGAVASALDTHCWHQWEAFGGRRILYLSADALEPLRAEEVLDSSSVLVIGGLVDYEAGHMGGARSGAALRVAEGRELRAVKLPIDEFVTLRKPSLTCLAVVQILACFLEHRDWGAAVRAAPAMRCAPLRKYVNWKC
jgi:tRNA (guanine9-N1)-methyltransferase